MAGNQVNKNTQNNNDTLKKQADEQLKRTQKRFSVSDIGGTLKRILSYALNYKWFFVFAMLFKGLSSGLNVTTNAMLKPIINHAVDGSPMETIVKYLILLLVMYVGAVVSFYLGERFIVKMAQNVIRKIRGDLFSHLQKLPIRFYDSRSHGDLMSTFTNDIDNLNAALEDSLGTLVTQIVYFIGTVIVMLIMSPVLSALVFIFMIFQLMLVKRLSMKSAEYFRKRQAALADVNGYIEEMIEGQKVIKVFNHEDKTIDDFNFKNEHLRKSGTWANTFATMMMPIMMNLSYVQFAIIAIIGSIFTINGTFGMDIGTLVAFLQASRNFTQPVVHISRQFNVLVAAVAGAERVFEVMDQPTEIDEGEVTLTSHEGQSYWKVPYATLERGHFRASGLPCIFCAADSDEQTELEKAFAKAFEEERDNETKKIHHKLFEDIQDPSTFRRDEEGNLYVPLKGDMRFVDLVFGYDPGQVVIDHISLFARPAQKIAFVGSTGAGKTTIVNLMNRFYEIDEGSILFDGIDIRDLKKHDLRSALGMVLQDIHLFSGTIRDNIRYGKLDATDEEIVAAAKYANAHEFIMNLPDNYDHELSPDGMNLSQGQRQLLSIARAAVNDPDVMILDEATSSVDTRTERQIERGMDQLTEGRTSFTIAHRLSTVRQSDAILLLEYGKIIERGDHDELMVRKGKYYELNVGKAKLT